MEPDRISLERDQPGLCGKHGISAASQALRHADIAIASAHYLDPRKRSTAGFGNLLKVSTDVVPINGEAEAADHLAVAGKRKRRVI
jgi:hypothetical protein